MPSHLPPVLLPQDMVSFLVSCWADDIGLD